jgi:thioredoxin reductase (NADPH)
MKNIVILGTGISGCTAAIYAARASLEPLLISGPEDGGQLMLTTEIENFPGFPEGIGGMELVEKCKKQAEKFGAQFKTDIVNGIEKIDNGFKLKLVSNEEIEAKTVIIATGASARWLGIPSEEKFKGRGVSSCATCDGAFYKDKEIIVIGGGDSAMEEALFLTRFASKVTIVHRRDELRASKFMQDKAKANEKIAFILDSVIEEIIGDKLVTGVKLKNLKTNEVTNFNCNGVFLAIGHTPNTKFLSEVLKLNKQGYIESDRFMKTSVPGIFAAGDVQDIRFRQAITAAGSGCMAAMEAEKYLLEKE